MRTKIMIALGVFVLAVLNWSVYTNEQLRQDGKVVYFKLAPVDPRSLMQGDYMQLNYALADDAYSALQSDGAQIEGYSVERSRGKLVLRIDEDNIARFSRVYAGGGNSPDSGSKANVLQENEVLFPYFCNGYIVKIRPDSFMFQEGFREYYERSEYGVFHFSDDGRYLLVGLADNEMKRLDAPEE
ncbi:MAG: GDYXXLXY domain-containing protein [Desulfovibrio sp.]